MGAELARISSESSVSQDPKQYCHFGDQESCPALGVLDKALHLRIAQLPALGSPIAFQFAAGLLPQMSFSVIEKYFRPFGETLSERLQERGTERLVHEEEIPAFLHQYIQSRPDLVIISAQIPQSQCRGEGYSVRVALRCTSTTECPLVVAVEDVMCQCVIKAANSCQHIAAVLVLVTLNFGRQGPVCTRLPATWQGGGSTKVSGVRFASKLCDESIKLCEFKASPKDFVSARQKAVAKSRSNITKAKSMYSKSKAKLSLTNLNISAALLDIYAPMDVDSKRTRLKKKTSRKNETS